MFVLFLLISVAAAAVGGPIRAGVEQKFDAAVKHYNLGEYEKAAAALDGLAALSPTGEEAWLLREKVGLGRLVKMLRRANTAPAARDIIEKAATRDEHLRRDPAAIRKLINATGDDVVNVRWKAMAELLSSGPFAVPFLLEPVMSDEKHSPVSRKSAAIIVLRRIGKAGVAPMVAALWHGDDATVMTVAGFIAATGDVRAVPPLLAVIEDPSRPEIVKHAARKALAQILKSAPEAEFASAATLCAFLARRYYYKDPALIEVIPAKDRVIWTWNPGGQTLSEKLVYRDVPGYAYPRIMSRRLALEGIKRAPASLKLQEIYAGNTYVYLDEAVANSDNVALELQKVEAINESLGADVLCAALERAVNDRNTALAWRCVVGLGRIADSRPQIHGSSLIRALAFPDVTVRVEAAEVLMRLSPDGTLGAPQVVVDAIAMGLGARPPARVAVVTDDGALYRRLSRVLRRSTVPERHKKSAAEAVKPVRRNGPPLDMLILDTRSDADAALALVRRIRGDSRTAALPIILIAGSRDTERLQAACAGQVTAILPVKADSVSLISAVKQALAKRPPAPAGTNVLKKPDLVRRVLATVVALPPKTAYPAVRLSRPIAALTKGQPEDIRLLALRALKTLGDASMRDTAYDLFVDGGEPLDIRRRAGETFLALLVSAPRLTIDQRTQLRKLTGDKDAVLAGHAVHGLAIAAVPDSERRKHLFDVESKLSLLR